MLVPMLGLLASLSPWIPSAAAVSLTETSADSVKSASSLVAANMMTYYFGSQLGNNPGNLPQPYYWWEAGGMFAHLIDYWYYTGDDQYNWQVRQAVTWQAGSNGAFMPANQTTDEGNDDQVFWGFTAAEAAETNFEAPLANESSLSYIAMAQSVAYTMNNRWDTTACGGGLRWQTQPFKGSGYLYKNSVANGGFFLLLSRIARYTGNNSYVDLADRSWDWFSTSVLYNPTTFQINDGTSMTENCTTANPQQWTYNYTLWMAGLAFLYNYTQNQKYLAPLKGIVGKFFATFAKNNILTEPCEPNSCDVDQYSFKSYDMRWLILTMQLVPELKDTITPVYKASAQGAAGQCNGPAPPNSCGSAWTTTTYTGVTGVGQEMSALAAIQGLMYYNADLKLPYTVATGGQGKPDANIGQGDTPQNNTIATRPITAGDRAGAGILTALALIFTCVGTYWLVT